MNQIPLQNGEIPNIPMNTLAGISSLTELLPELPLPTPHPSTVNNKSLLYSQRVIEEARRLVANPDENLVPHLVQALGQTSTDHIELKDNSGNAEVEGDLPPLLQAVLACNPNVFNQRTRSVEPHSSNHGGGISPRTPMAPSPYYQQSPDGMVQHSPYQRSHTPMAQQQQGSPSPYSQNSPYPQGSPAKYGPQPSPYPQGSPSSRYQPQESSAKYAAQGSPARHMSQGSPGKFHPPTFPLGHQQQNIPQGVPSNTCNGYSANQFSPAPSPAVGSPPSANVMSPPQTPSRVLGQHQPKAIPALSPTSLGGGLPGKPAAVTRPSAAAAAEPLQQPQSEPQLQLLEQENQEPAAVFSAAHAAHHMGGEDKPQDPAGQPEEKQRLEKIKLRMVPGGAEPVVVLEPLSPKDKMLLSKSRPMSSKSVDAQSAAQAFAFDDSTSADEHSSKETRISLKRKKKSKSHREEKGRYVPEVRYNIISSPTKDSPKLTLKLSRTVISPKTGQQLRPSELPTQDREKFLHTTESDKSGKGNVDKTVPEIIPAKKDLVEKPAAQETVVEKDKKVNQDKVASDSTRTEKAAIGAATPKEAITNAENKSKERTAQKSDKKELSSLQDSSVKTGQSKVEGKKLESVEQKKLQESNHSTQEVQVVQISDSPTSPKVPTKATVSKTRSQAEKMDTSASEGGPVGPARPHMTRRSLAKETNKRDPVAVVMLERLGPGNDMYSNIKSKRRRGLPAEDKSEEVLHIVEALVPKQDESAVRSTREKSHSSPIAQTQDRHADMNSGAKSRAKKRKHSEGQEEADIMDLENFPDPFEDMYSSIKNKRRRKASANALKAMEIGSKDEDSGGETVAVSKDREERTAAVMEEVIRQRKEKRKRREKREQAQPQLTMEELMESSTFKRFTSLMDSVFESSEDMELDIDADDDDDEIPADSLIPKAVLSELCGEAAKLKSMGVMNQVAAERLVRLMNILERNIRDGAKLQPLLVQEADGEEEQRLWRELTFERVMRSADSCLTALFITTSTKMPKQVFIEDTIERLVMYAKYHLQNTIYPEFDPVYRTPDNKDGIVWNSRMKRAHHKGARHKSVVSLYNKLCEIVSLLAELLEVEMMTDTVILQVSSLATTPFFVENVSELQLSALKLVMSVFSRYEKHRQLILEDIFASLAKLPSSKRNLRSYRLNSEDNIQMVTALVLSLIQCVVTLPEPEPADSDRDKEEKTKEDKKSKDSKMDDDVLIASSYETAMRTAQNFLSIFLKKCTSKEEEDYRPLFENFVQDLLATVNKPEWPAAELLLSLLGRLLVHHFSNRSTEMSLRVSSLDYLGMVAARLRKDAVSSELDQDTLDAVMDEINSISEDESVQPEKDESTSPAFPDGDQTQTFQRAMLDYLAENSDTDPALHFARQFYIAQWYRDSTAQIERSMKGKKSKRAEDDSDNEDDDDEDEDDKKDEPVSTVDVMQAADMRKKFLLTMVQASHGPLGTLRTKHSNLSYENACLIARYLASQRPFSQSFDIYLQQILRVLSENAIAVRTRAMKCLTAVVAVDPGILARADMQKGVHGRFMDQSTSVREAALELVGKFVLLRTELIPQYYDMIIERILDTGISVRKRVIKILRDICLEVPKFTKVTEMCVKMIRRVNDEEGIKKLVNDVFQQMWFSPVKSSDEESLFRKVINITDVVDACKETGYDWFEQLLTNLLKAEENASYKPASKACVQITNCLVQNVLSLEEKTAETVESRTSSHRLVSSLQTLYLFSKVRPELLVDHAMTLQPYLSTQCSTQGDYLVLHNVARILQLVVPLMEHPSEVFLASLEEDLMKLIIKHGMMILQACVSCLAAVVNSVTHNIKLVWDCFQKYFGVLGKLKQEHSADPESQALQQNRPTLLRSLFTVGLLCKHFDFDRKMKGQTKVCIKDKVFEVLMYFMDHPDEAVQHKALTGIGFLAIQHPDLMMGSQMTKMYHRFLMEESSVKLKCQVLRNLQNYLTEEDAKLRVADAEWSKNAKQEDLKEMGDISSGMGSSIMQIYLKHVMETFFHSQTSVRMAALHVIVLVLKQGLVHPVQCVPYLVAMGTDEEVMVRNKADQQLSEIDHKYTGFIHMKALAGIKMSFKLQQIAQKNGDTIVRGMREDENRAPAALCSHLYSLVRCNRQHRRALLLSLLKLFDDETCQLDVLLYVADNLACFPFATQDEPLFLIHHIDIILSVTGANVLQSFREALHPSKKTTEQKEGGDDEEGSPVVELVDDDDLDEDQLLAQFPSDPKALLDCCIQAHGCILLLMLKQYLKDLYGFTDSKCHRYSPTEAAKVYDKSLNRRSLPKFSPQSVLDYMCAETPDFAEDEEARRQLIEHYLDFKQLMLRLDPAEDDDDTPERESTSLSRTKITPTKDTNSTNDKALESKKRQSGPETDGDQGQETVEEGKEGSVTKSEGQVVSEKSSSVLKSRRGRPPKEKPTPKPAKRRQRRKRRRVVTVDSDDDDEEGDSSDPDFML
ncbi:PREDICTED: nipped-B-like protein [Branchiostoma belcheri]|uniref:Nipped-B protein n=1 Tax=Branchiostoma belcheri TaxID=7741 RepID=A0A6P4ZX38_BRABE|nr:PREDICTED: nipped-B-like protein [Branchiostoma belcheri]